MSASAERTWRCVRSAFFVPCMGYGGRSRRFSAAGRDAVGTAEGLLPGYCCGRFGVRVVSSEPKASTAPAATTPGQPQRLHASPERSVPKAPPMK